MPHYDYSCPDCKRFDEDVFQRGTDPVRQGCPTCGSKLYRRHIGAGRVGIVKESGEDPTATARRRFKTKLGEQVFTNPYTQKTEILKGSKKARQRQAENSIMKADPTVKRSDINLMNL